MLPLRFVPTAEADGVANVVVDGSPNAGTVLTISHWPGMAASDDLHADTSTEMALRYVDLGADRHGTAQAVTNNHFDQDGLAGIFTLVDPEAALARRDLVADLAHAGDFATYRHRSAARASMTIAAMANASDADPATGLYPEALGLLAELLDHPDRFRRWWADEDAVLDASEAAVASGLVDAREDPALDLAVVVVDPSVAGGRGTRFTGRYVDGLHPMALHALTPRCRVLVVHGDRYRYTDRYETWVQYRSRPLPRRVDLAPLADELTSMERGGARWTATGPGDLTPELAVGDGAPSSLPLDTVENALRRHLTTAPPGWDPYT